MQTNVRLPPHDGLKALSWSNGLVGRLRRSGAGRPFF